jgi:allantoate deiminase
MELSQSIDAAGLRLLERIRILNGVSTNTEWLERTLFSPAAEAAAYKLKSWMEAAGMEVTEDALTNVIGKLNCSPDGPDASTIHLGSHYDTVINGGAYDGALGVLIAIATVEAIAGAQIPMQHNLSALAFCDEEGVRFQTTFLGSSALSGQFEKAWLYKPDALGKKLGQWLVDRGESIDEVLYAEPTIRPQDFFIESHIEQGPVLESANKSLGVFTKIAAQLRAEVELHGMAGHAGTTPYRLRKDPLPYASEMILEVNKLCRSDERVRATVGQLNVFPNASNVIPSRVTFTVDLRLAKYADLVEAHEALQSEFNRIAKRSGLQFVYRVKHTAEDVTLDPRLTGILSSHCQREADSSIQVFSGAGHDSMKIAQVCPVGLLAVRCRDGLSHHPDEFSTDEDCLAALKVMVGSVLEIDREL